MASAFDRNVHCLLGLPFDAVDMAGTVARIRVAVARREPCVVATPNVNWLVACATDQAFRNSVIESDLSIADGMPIVWVAKLLGVPVEQRIAGSGVFEHLQWDDQNRLAIYFFGGAEGVAESACKQLNSNSSALACVGWDGAGFGSVEELSSEKAIARINASGADFVVVSLGAQKGQAWISRNRGRLDAPVVSHLGAVMSFVAGMIRRAPLWAQRSGLEWLWRIKEEPRLWRRYVVDGMKFFRLLVLRVVPYAWFIFWQKPGHRELDSAAIETREQGREVVVCLSGAWAMENLEPFRECIARLARDGKDVLFDMERVRYIDSAFIGTLMLFYANSKTQRRRLTFSGLSNRVRRIFRYACAEFLLDPS